MTRYLIEYRWFLRGEWTDWATANAPLANSLDEVFEAIREFSEYDNSMVHHTHAGPGGTVRVTVLDEWSGWSDVTTEALMHYARRWLERTGECVGWVEEALEEAA